MLSLINLYKIHLHLTKFAFIFNSLKMSKSNLFKKVKCEVTSIELPELRVILSDDYCDNIVKVMRFPQTNVGNFRFLYTAFDVDNNILLRYERRSFKVDNKKDSKKEEYLYFNYFALHCRSRTSYLLYPEDKNINSKSSKKYDDTEVSSNQKLPDNMLDEDDEISEDNKFNLSIKSKQLNPSSYFLNRRWSGFNEVDSIDLENLSLNESNLNMAI